MQTTPDSNSVGGCLLLVHQAPITQPRTMRRRNRSWYLAICLSAACARSPIPQSGQPTPADMPQNPVPVPPVVSSWTFNYAPGTVSYQVSRGAAIESQSDSGLHQEISTNITHETLTLAPAGDTVRFSATVDTFSTTSQGTISPVQLVQLPVQLSGSFFGDSLAILADSTTEKCNLAGSALSADLHNLLLHLPTQLTRGSSWRDSSEVKTCQGMIPITVHIARSYLVSGGITFEASPVLVVQRVDTIQAHGEGAQQQHQLTVDATGTGNAIYYMSPKEGRVLHLSTGQDLMLAITASGTTHHFKQRLKQDFNLVR